MSSRRSVVLAVLASFAFACAGASPDELKASDQSLGQSRDALVANGDFAAGLSTDWNVVTALNNGNGLLHVPPRTHADLALSDANTDFINNTQAALGAAGSIVPSMLSAGASLRLPFRSASYAAVNLNGNATRASAIEQNITFALGDLDPFDNKPRLRAIIAPVVSYNGNHLLGQQAYVFAHLDNLSRTSADVATFYTYAGAPGLPWRADSGFNYYGWQVVELTPSVADLALGDSLKFGLWSAGCSKNGHFATTFVDSVGDATRNGTSVVAYGPEYVRAGGNIAYDVRVRQEGVAGSGNRTVSMVLPANVNFSSFAAPSTWVCQTPNVGQTGFVICQLPPMEAGESVQVQLRGTVPSTATGSLDLGTYGVLANDLPALLGPRVTTGIVASTMLLPNVTVSAVQSTTGDSDTLTHIDVVIGNNGEATAINAHISDVLGAGLVGSRYSCVAGVGASCGGQATATGTGSLALVANIDVGATITCSVTLQKQQASGQTPYGVVATPASGSTDTTAHDSEAVALVSLAAPAAGLLPIGTPSAASDLCQSGVVADGVCCDRACNGACEACDVTGTTGTCSPLDGVAPRASHPSCGPYTCVAGACAVACDTNDVCISAYHCEEHLCQATRGACTVDADCPAGRQCTPAHTCESPETQDLNHPAWKLMGSGCRHNDGQLGAWVVAMAAGLWFWRRRRRAARVVAVALVMGIGAAAHADDSANVPTNHFLPLGGAQDVFGTASPTVNGAFDASFKLWANYARSPLRLVTSASPAVRQDIVHHQATLDVTGSLALPLRLELGVALPIVLQQAAPARFVNDKLAHHRVQTALGDLRLTPKWGLLQGDLVRLGVAVFVSAPTGRRGEYVSLRAASFTPSALLELGPRRGLRLLVNAGALLRPARNLADARLRHALSWSAAAVLPKQISATSHVQLAAGAFGESNLRAHQAFATPVEVLGTLGYGTRSGWSVEAGGGAGVTNGIGAPRWRVLLALGYAHRSEEPMAAPVVEPPAATPSRAVVAPVASQMNEPASDRDGDGIPDDEDACPDVAGPHKGPRPGCPIKAQLRSLLDNIRLVTFANNSAVIDGENAALLERVRQILVAHPDVRLGIDGHTDDSGKAARNRSLSKLRAEAAKHWLELHDIAPTRLQAQGFGSAHPVDPRSSAAARQKNRRVAFRILKASGSPSPDKAPKAPKAAVEPTTEAELDPLSDPGLMPAQVDTPQE